MTEVPKGLEALAAFWDEMWARPPVVYDTIRAACEGLGGGGYTPRAIRQAIYEGVVKAKKLCGSPIWREVEIPYLWWHGCPAEMRRKKNEQRRERRKRAAAARRERAKARKRGRGR